MNGFDRTKVGPREANITSWHENSHADVSIYYYLADA